MSERPDQWYIDGLQRKHEAQLRAAVIAYWIPRALGLIAVVALVVIAWKL